MKKTEKKTNLINKDRDLVEILVQGIFNTKFREENKLLEGRKMLWDWLKDVSNVSLPIRLIEFMYLYVEMDMFTILFPL